MASKAQEKTPKIRRLRLQPTLFIVFAILFAAAWGASWVHVRDRVKAQREYSLEALQIEVGSITSRRRNVPSQIHGVVQNSEHVDRRAPLMTTEAKQDEMTPLTPSPYHMQRKMARGNITSCLDTRNFRPAR